MDFWNIGLLAGIAAAIFLPLIMKLFSGQGQLLNVFKIPDLKKRILFTIGILILYRIGCHIPTPGINADFLVRYFDDPSQKNSILGMIDLFTGGAMSRAAVFGLGIMPYISASIVIQLLGAVIPYFQRLQKEGEEGRKKINQITRYGTVLIATMQGLAACKFLVYLNSFPNMKGLVPNPNNPLFYVLVTVTMCTGTVLLMWLGEQITERGIGNGISLIIFTGIIARLPLALRKQIGLWLRLEEKGTILTVIFVFALLFMVIVSVVLITEGTRKIPVQYAKRVIGRKIYGGQATYIPIRVSGFGVMAIIFAQSLMFIPQTILQFFPGNRFIESILGSFNLNSPVYWIFYAILILFFTYFYAAIAFNPADVADNMQKQGGFIPGVRPGKKTADYIDHVLSRIMLPAALFFAVIAILPSFMTKKPFELTHEFSQFFGGTSILIMVGVALDTLQQIESHLVMRHYDGFLKTGRIRGRR